MAEGRGQAEWGRMSALMALLANIHRDPKKREIKPSDFNPFCEKKQHRLEKLSEVKEFFVRGEKDGAQVSEMVVGSSCYSQSSRCEASVNEGS